MHTNCGRHKKAPEQGETLLRRGAGGGGRTHTVLLPTDFEFFKPFGT